MRIKSPADFFLENYNKIFTGPKAKYKKAYILWDSLSTVPVEYSYLELTIPDSSKQLNIRGPFSFTSPLTWSLFQEIFPEHLLCVSTRQGAGLSGNRGTISGEHKHVKDRLHSK